jgi:hypothetical protein
LKSEFGKKSRTIMQQLGSEQKTTIKDRWKSEIEGWKHFYWWKE